MCLRVGSDLVAFGDVRGSMVLAKKTQSHKQTHTHTHTNTHTHARTHNHTNEHKHTHTHSPVSDNLLVARLDNVQEDEEETSHLAVAQLNVRDGGLEHMGGGGGNDGKGGGG